MKLLLSAPAVAKLVELDPDGTVELAKSVAAQVAQEISRRMTREAVLRAGDAFLDADIVEGDHRQKHISAKYAKIVGKAMTALAAPFMESLTSGTLKTTIEDQVRVALAAQMPAINAILTERADMILHQRFAVMFGPVDAQSQASSGD